MPHDRRSALDEDAARDEIRQVMVTAFCSVLHRTSLSPMGVMRLAAMAVGSLYREVAEAHEGADRCPCGWEPSEEADLPVLQDAFAAQAKAPVCTDFGLVRTVGTA